MIMQYLMDAEELRQWSDRLRALPQPQFLTLMRHLHRTACLIDPEADWSGCDRSEWSTHAFYGKMENVDPEDVVFLTLTPGETDAWEHLVDFPMLALVLFEGQSEAWPLTEAHREKWRDALPHLVVRCHDRSLYPSPDEDGFTACHLATALMAVGAAAEAAEYYRVAAQKNNTAACCNLAFMLQHGIGVPKDEQEAQALYKRAAELGDPHAKHRLKFRDPNTPSSKGHT